MPGVGLGRLGGAGRSTVPIAWGADEVGTPAQPATSSASAPTSATITPMAPGHTCSPACSRGREPGSAFRSGTFGFSGNGLVVTLCPRTNGRVSRKQAPFPGLAPGFQAALVQAGVLDTDGQAKPGAAGAAHP